MKDIQNQKDHRCVDIRKVGVKTVKYPIVVLDKARTNQHTVATINMYVNLPHQFKGTHMSRFLEILNECHGAVDFRNFQDILVKMKERLDAEASHLEMFFPYFMQHDKTRNPFQFFRYNCGFHGSLKEESNIELTLEVPVYGDVLAKSSAGYWGKVVLRVGFKKFYWIEDIIEQVELTIAREVENLNVKLDALAVDNLSQCLADLLASIEEVKHFQVVVHQQCVDYTAFSQIDSCDG